MVSRSSKSSMPLVETSSKVLPSTSSMVEHSDYDELSNGSLRSPPSQAEASTTVSNNDTNGATATAYLNLGVANDENDKEEDTVRDNNDKNEQQMNDNEANEESVGPLYKSSRLRGYMTLALASFINFDAADNSAERIGIHVSVITSTPKQRGYAATVAVVSLIISAACFIVHLDRFSPLRKFWQTLFKPGSKFEGLILAFLTTWWTVAAGVNTSVRGLAGDGRGQFSLYYSTWVCCFTCYWMVERWWVAAGVCTFLFIDGTVSLQNAHHTPLLFSYRVSSPSFTVGPIALLRGSACSF
jgi:hypothetical protein